jgi:hypothetical protein
MPDEKVPETIGAALNDIHDDSDLGIDTTDTGGGDSVDEGVSAEGASGGEGEAEAASAEGADDEEGASDDEDEGAEGEDDEPENPLEALSAEELAAIKANPATAKLYKTLMRATTKKWQDSAEALRLVDAYRRDPVGVLQAIARANNMEVRQPDSTPRVDPNAAALQQAHARLLELFGDQVGPEVGRILATMVSVATGAQVGPVRDALGRVVLQGEQARMLSEEQQFKSAHRGELTPDIEAEIIKLGNSGEYVPGPTTTPRQYLETLYNIVTARRGRVDAGKRLRDRIRGNASTREPSGVGARAGVASKSKVRPDMSLAEAFEVAARELDEEGA